VVSLVRFPLVRVVNLIGYWSHNVHGDASKGGRYDG